RERILAPHPRNRLDRLGPSRPRLLGSHAEAEQLVHRGRAPGAELDAPIRHDVEHGDPFRHMDWMAERQYDDAVPDPNLPRALRNTREENLGRRAVRKF